jgi:hypothetical protein
MAGYLLDLEKLHDIIRKVERRAQAQHRENIDSEDRRAVIAMEELQTSVQEFKERNKIITEDYAQFVDELFLEKTWLSSALKWDQEDKEQGNREAATKRENLRQAIKLMTKTSIPPCSFKHFLSRNSWNLIV